MASGMCCSQRASQLTVNFNLHVALLVSANAFCTLCCAVHFSVHSVVLYTFLYTLLCCYTL